MPKKNSNLKDALADLAGEARTALAEVLTSAGETDDARLHASSVVELGRCVERLAKLKKRLANGVK